MNWQELCDDSILQNLPYKFELNRLGQILMSPASNQHGFFQLEIGAELKSQMHGGRVITECSIETNDGIRVADVAWGSDDFFSKLGLATPLPRSPEICVEIVSPSNSKEELALKAGLYFEAGASEVWFCDESGRMKFQLGTEIVEHSRIAPTFPCQIVV